MTDLTRSAKRGGLYVLARLCDPTLPETIHFRSLLQSLMAREALLQISISSLLSIALARKDKATSCTHGFIMAALGCNSHHPHRSSNLGKEARCRRRVNGETTIDAHRRRLSVVEGRTATPRCRQA